MDHRDSELDYELRRLPSPRAPGALLPRVMAAIEERRPAPWHSRAWVTWPRGLQVTSASAAVLVIAGVIWGLPAATSHWTVVQTAGEVSTLARVFWHTWLQPLASYFVAALILLSLVCFAAYSVVSRLTPELETSPQ